MRHLHEGAGNGELLLHDQLGHQLREPREGAVGDLSNVAQAPDLRGVVTHPHPHPHVHYVYAKHEPCVMTRQRASASHALWSKLRVLHGYTEAAGKLSASLSAQDTWALRAHHAGDAVDPADAYRSAVTAPMDLPHRPMVLTWSSVRRCATADRQVVHLPCSEGHPVAVRHARALQGRHQAAS